MNLPQVYMLQHSNHNLAAAAAAAKSLQSCPTLCDPIDVWQPTRLPRPWDSPGKNTGVGCHFLLQCTPYFPSFHLAGITVFLLQVIPDKGNLMHGQDLNHA